MTPSNRRGFLKKASSVPVAAVIPGVALGVVASPALGKAIGKGLGTAAISGTADLMLHRQHFTALLGQEFTMNLEWAEGTTHARVKLTALEDLPHCADPQQSFRAVFESVQADGLRQGLWQVSHPELGQHAIFLSPNDALGREVEAVFNRG